MRIADEGASPLVARFIAAVTMMLGAGLLCAIPARAEGTLRGNANIVDGDTINIAGIPIRLEGIDAPEQQQSCTGDNTSTVPCGELATKALARFIGRALVTCVLLGRDGYNRLL